jgi:hypothetical protein
LYENFKVSLSIKLGRFCNQQPAASRQEQEASDQKPVAS